MAILVDSFNRKINYLRLSLTDKCDLRCLYCMPKGFKSFEQPKNWLDFDEIYRIVKLFSQLGVNSIRLTGGEPLLRKDIIELISRLNSIVGIEQISLTTNGTQLAQYAELLSQVGVTTINVSLDSLDKNKFKKITGFDQFEKVMLGIQQAKKQGLRIKINMVLLNNINTDELNDMIQFCIGNEFILKLIELMPIGQTGQSFDTINLTEYIQPYLNKYQLINTKKVKGNGPANYWIDKNSNFCLGLITPLSKNFCDSCNRLRISVDGTLYTCLGQNNCYSLRDMLRSSNTDNEIKTKILQLIKLKPESHNFLENPQKIIRIMSMIGG